MDPHETTNSPHPHHDQLENVILVEPNPFTNTTQTTIMEPNTAQLSPIIMNANLSPNYEPIVNNIVPSSLNPSISVSSDTESIKRKRGRPRKHFPIGNIASSLGSDPGPTLASIATSPSSSTCKKSTSGKGRGRPRGSFKKKHLVETHGVTESCFSPHVIFVNQGEVCNGTYNSNINMLYITLSFTFFSKKNGYFINYNVNVYFDNVKKVVVYRIFENVC
ncbi:putative AT hook, DNA-binding protein [Medicago truncatula]|uniref:Putative AT hook, DNA-binding protein n=1 Tax=Medicago truncatula TaxID=3880 RepID=A0A396HN60_MEDTR|nr:putative AT hook, DNA-binding protein [Medicago truncatula]